MGDQGICLALSPAYLEIASLIWGQAVGSCSGEMSKGRGLAARHPSPPTFPLDGWELEPTAVNRHFTVAASELVTMAPVPSARFGVNLEPRLARPQEWMGLAPLTACLKTRGKNPPRSLADSAGQGSWSS